MIFFFSAQTGEESMELSDGLTKWIILLFHPDFDSLPEGRQNEILSFWFFLIRKLAHFTEFAMLGASLRLLIGKLEARKPLLLSWLFGTLYACTDEWHQMFVDARGPQARDVCIDSVGALFGAAAVGLLLWLHFRHKQRKKQSQ